MSTYCLGSSITTSPQLTSQVIESEDGQAPDEQHSENSWNHKGKLRLRKQRVYPVIYERNRS